MKLTTDDWIERHLLNASSLEDETRWDRLDFDSSSSYRRFSCCLNILIATGHVLGVGNGGKHSEVAPAGRKPMKSFHNGTIRLDNVPGRK